MRIKKSATSARKKVATRKKRKTSKSSLGRTVRRIVVTKFKKPKYNYGTLVCLKTDRTVPCDIAQIQNTVNHDDEVLYQLHYLAGRKKYRLSDWIEEREITLYKKPR